MYFQRVIPQKVRATLKYPRRVNRQHQNVLIKDCNINEDLLSSGSNIPKNNIGFDLESKDELKSTSNPSLLIGMQLINP